MTQVHDAPELSVQQRAGLASGERSAVLAVVRELPRPRLAAWLATPDGAAVLHDAFRRMPTFYRGGAADGTLARWQVRRPPAEPIGYDLALSPDTCTVRPADPGVRAAVTLTFDAAGFVEMACAARGGVELLLNGHLQIQGDVPLAMRMERMFGLDAGAAR
ncbi:SCP2 sterol-binding domain-containing protein [Dactylosporangium vinaceum]|uniref:SCP2 sterol-binding domain-containing protein n=1 Tax=Dactylosporangium vinaceum TaxID=53362 RepID=A0ABV5M9W8_9ACTN|nr:SCP2 sterol-binding domain-containing protein [Dactylosporangium vinaceum]UAB93149.1 SCP2 sterol-binding domain-containing protein [Dactylosporangium vinaceum]